MTDVSILFAGDVVPYGKTVELFEHKQTNTLFHDVLQIINSSDYSVVNYESPVIEGAETPIPKSGPNLYSSPKAMEVVKEAGFNMLTLANNHFRDQGQNGVETTIKWAEKLGVDFVGGGKTLEETRKIKYKQIKEKTFAFINVCEHEYSIADEEAGGANPYDIINIHHDICEAHAKSDYVILIIHGGIEHYQLPAPRMKREYRYFIELGADAIINHHQHCYSGYEFYHGKPIFYGLGNFCFDRPAYRNNGTWDKGYMVKLRFSEKEICHQIFPYQQCLDSPSVRLLPANAFDDNLERLNRIIQDDILLEEEYSRWADNRAKGYLSQLNAFGFRCFDKINKRGWLGKLYRKQRLFVINDLINCETHLDVIKKSVNNLIK